MRRKKVDHVDVLAAASDRLKRSIKVVKEELLILKEARRDWLLVQQRCIVTGARLLTTRGGASSTLDTYHAASFSKLTLSKDPERWIKAADLLMLPEVVREKRRLEMTMIFQDNYDIITRV